MALKDLFVRDTRRAMNATSLRKRTTRSGWILLIVVSIVSSFSLTPWFWAALTVALAVSYWVFGGYWANRNVSFEIEHRAAPNPRHLLWALPLGILVCAAWWWFEAGLWNYGGFYRLSQAEIDAFDSSSVKNYIVSALFGSIPILVANWSRSLWPRLALTVALVAVNLISGSIFVLAPRAAL